MSEIKRGDRVKVEYEGVAGSTRHSYDGNFVSVTRDGDGKVLTVKEDFVTVIEPAYEQDCIYVDGRGDVWYRLGRSSDRGATSWRHCETGGVRYHSFPTRPLRKLVPES